MKKRVAKLAHTLSLDKELIAKLNEEQLGGVVGGQHETATLTGLSGCPAGPATAAGNGVANSCIACACNS